MSDSCLKCLNTRLRLSCTSSEVTQSYALLLNDVEQYVSISQSISASHGVSQCSRGLYCTLHCIDGTSCLRGHGCHCLKDGTRGSSSRGSRPQPPRYHVCLTRYVWYLFAVLSLSQWLRRYP